MKRILVPIDNTRISKRAVVYAAGLAERLNAQVILLSVINASSTPNTLKNWRKLEEQLVSKEQEEVSRMIREVKTETGTSARLSYKYVLGYPVEEMVEQFVRDNGIDLIVMGTGGARGMKKIAVGTHTASVIDHSSVPVVAVPKNAPMTRIRKIVFATDMSYLDKEIKTIARFAKLFEAGVEVLYVTGENQRKRSRKELESILVRMARYPSIRFNTITGSDVAKGLHTFVTRNKADILAMFTHKLDLFEKLFGRSITRKLAFDSAVPLLAFNRTNT
jgi:nucleotide-binding universal stress UspA family protein